MSLPFIKMHGLGNDFVIFDGRARAITFSPHQVKTIADRHTGVGCDQVIVLGHPRRMAGSGSESAPDPATSAGIDVFMHIYNADGGEISSCGNATRCVAWMMMEETGQNTAMIQTKAGLLNCERMDENHIRADMGEPKFGWQDIPLSEPRDTLHMGIALGDLSDPTAVSMGNPHMVFVVKNVAETPVAELGPTLEHHPLFPERANVSFAQPLSDSRVRLRVWERGAGETQACGTAACATLVGLHRRGLIGRKASIELPGGALDIEWDAKTNHVFMTGPVAVSFNGVFNPAE